MLLSKNTRYGAAIQCNSLTICYAGMYENPAQMELYVLRSPSRTGCLPDISSGVLLLMVGSFLTPEETSIFAATTSQAPDLKIG